MNKSAESKFENKLSGWANRAVLACFVFVFLFSVYGISVSPKIKLFGPMATEYKEDWYVKKADGEIVIAKAPVRLDVEVGEPVSMSTKLPDTIEEGTYLCISSGRSFTAYVDGVEIFSMDMGISRIPGKVIKTVAMPVPLKESYAGKTLTIERNDKSVFNGSLSAVYIGNLLGICKTLIANGMTQFLSAFLLAIASFITLIVFLALSKKRGRDHLPLIYLSEGILATSLWIIFDSVLFQLVTGKMFFDGVTAYMLAILLTVPFMMYFDSIQEYRYRKVFITLKLVSFLNFIIVSVLHFADIVSFEDSLVYIDLWLMVDIIVIICLAVYDYYFRKEKSHKNVMIGLIGIGAMGGVEVIFIILKSEFRLRYTLDGLFTVIGMFILLLFATLDQVQQLALLQRRTQEAVAATKAKSAFLANMSHEIRTPINAIMGMNEMILRESNQDSVKEYARDVSSASANLLEIVNDILDFSKIESGMLEIIDDDYFLGELISDVTSLVNMKAEAKGLKLNVSVSPELPRKLHGDDKRVREIITNIVNNAVKYTDKGHIDLNVGGEITGDEVKLSISVSDTGQGIRPENIDKIFGGFERVDEKKNKNIEGTGLGLSITKNLVELMNGSIDVESEYGKGSKFTVVLPQKIVEAEPMGDYRKQRHASKDEQESANKAFEAPDAKVLVVDDTPLNLLVISRLLSKTKMQITSASSGAEALKLMAQERFDIILLDHMMPNMDGIETLNASKSMSGNKCKNVPVIALTANAIVGAKEMYLEAGFSDYLSKPVLPKALEEILIKYISDDKIKMQP